MLKTLVDIFGYKMRLLNFMTFHIKLLIRKVMISIKAKGFKWFSFQTASIKLYDQLH